MRAKSPQTRSAGDSQVGRKEVRWSADCSLADEYLEELGLKAEGMFCYALRHSAAIWSRARRARLDAIAGMLCHTSITTTGVYAKIVDKIAENPARYLEELMGLS